MNEKTTLHKITEICTRGSELIPLSILCNSVGSSCMRDPLVVSAGDSVAYCVDLLAEHKTGSVLVVDDDEHLVGIFTERDCVIKVLRGSPEVLKQPVRELMTKEPVSERPDTTIAFALNLMSHGGFRNLPIVDEAGHPVGVLSVKDVIDYLVGCMMEGIDGVTHSS